jgi:hypothetical protein
LQPVEPAHGTRGSSEAALSQEAGAGAQGARGGPRAAPEPRGGSHGNRAHASSRAPLSNEAGAGAMGRAYMHARLIFHLGLELVREGTQSSGYQQ